MNIHVLGLLSKRMQTTLVVGCVMAIVFSLAHTVLAEYQPPRDQKPPSGYTDSSGVR